MISSVGVYNDKYYYKGREYDKLKINLLIKSLGRKRKIIILSQPIFIREYKIGNEKINLEKFLDKKITEDFSDRENLLFHYEFIKENETIYLYSIRYDTLRNLCKDCNFLKIEPIQFVIKNYILKKIKNNKSIIVIYKINDLFHLLNIENKIIKHSVITNDENDIDLFIKNYTNDKKIIVMGKGTKFSKSIMKNIKVVNIGEKCYEKIFKI